MRNTNQSSRQSGGRESAGVGEFRAVAERLLETGAQYLEQGRQWLHEATRGQPREGHAPDGRETRFDVRSRDSAGGATHADSRRTRPPYAPDEYSFSETGGVFHTRAGQHDQAPGGHGFQADRDEPYRSPSRGRATGPDWSRRSGQHWSHHDGNDFLSGSYGFGGEGRHEPGGLPDSQHAPSEQAGWERAYAAQGRASYRGRGPRGYVRSDERILDDIHERLCDDPIVDATDIEVHCDQGRVVLDGKVPTRWMKHRTEDIVDAVRGTKDIDNRIRVMAEEPVAQGDFDTSRTTGAATRDGEHAANGHAHGAGSTGAAGRDIRPPGGGTVSEPGTATGPSTTSPRLPE